MTPKYDIPFGRPLIDDSDKSAVIDVLSGHILTHGPKCEEFEELFASFTGGGHAITTSSCMASLHLAAIHYGFGPGDEVIVPSQTHVATVHAVELVGATPVFVDCELVTGNIDPDLIEKSLTPKTKAIFFVHYLGIPAQMDRICEIAKKHNLVVVEDCALAIGSYFEDKHVGLWGDIGCYSFYPVKHITTGEGGMLTTKHADVAQKIANFRAFSVDRTHTERKTLGVYDVTGVGLNYRMSEMQAALGCTQVAKLPYILEKRKNNFVQLKRALEGEQIGGIILDSDNIDKVNSHYCMVYILPEEVAECRGDIIMKLKELGIGTSVYYPQPVPRMRYYLEKYHTPNESYKNAAVISDHGIALPVGPHLNTGNMEDIATEIANLVKFYRDRKERA